MQYVVSICIGLGRLSHPKGGRHWHMHMHACKDDINALHGRWASKEGPKRASREVPLTVVGVSMGSQKN